MKRVSVLVMVASSFSCALFHSKPAPYPTGIIFPLAEAVRLEYDGKLVGALVKTDGRVYFSTDKGLVYCLDGAARKLLWSYAVASPLGSAPAVGAESVGVWDDANNIYCLDQNGVLLWKIPLQQTISSDIGLAKGRYYLGTKEGHLVAIDTAAGRVLWTFRTGGAVEASPVVWRDAVIAGSTDGKLYFLSPQGNLREAVDAGSPIHITPLVDGDRLYLGTDGATFDCLDLNTHKRKWKIRTGGKILSRPRADLNRVLFAASNCVLYALNKYSGNINWWTILPSRSSSIVEFAGNLVIVASSSSRIICLDRRTGRETGQYEAASEVRSNPVWLEPDLLISLHDFALAKGILVFLQKEIKVDLVASPPSPVAVGTEVNFTASSVGFHLPRFEFYTRTNGEQTVTQRDSAKNSWTWFPDKEGKYIAGVRVRDLKETRETELPFEVIKK